MRGVPAEPRWRVGHSRSRPIAPTRTCFSLRRQHPAPRRRASSWSRAWPPASGLSDPGPSRRTSAISGGSSRHVRTCALWLLWVEAYDELDALFATYEDDAAAAFAYTKALAAFRRKGASAEARQLLDEAHEMNPHVVGYLTGRKALPKRLPDYVGFGDESEAIDYASSAAVLWARVPGALAWLEA